MRRSLCAVAVLFTVATIRSPALAQVDPYLLEAAYIFDFTAFTDWPPAPSKGPDLVVCVNPRGDLPAALATVEGRSVATRIWRLRPLANTNDLSGCDVLVVDGSGTKTPRKQNDALVPNLPLLIVRTPDAAEGSYVIRLVREGDRLRFDIDNSEALRRHLRLSSKLLRLARNVT